MGGLGGSRKPGGGEGGGVRRAGITATDLPRILGLSKYGNALSVWMDKRGDTLPDDDNEAAYWGTLLEEPVANRWADLNGTGLRRVGVLANVEHPWRLASLDFLVDDCPDGDGPCGLEVKTRSAFTAGRWRDDVPDDVLAQVLWQIVVAGHAHEHVAVLFGGQRMESYRVDRDDNTEIIRFVVEEAERVWAAVLADEKPDVDPTEALTKILDALYPNRSGERDIDRLTAAALLADWKAAGAAEKAAKAQREAARARIVEALDDAETLVVGGNAFLSYCQATRKGYTVAPTTYRKVQIIDASVATDTEG
jgi:putative phage-type endonuclease